MDRVNKLRELLKTNPADAFLQHALALEYVKGGNDAEARIVFERLLQANEQYIGSYYHLAKLFERGGESDKAAAVYEKGMQMAKQAGDNHAYNELRSAHEVLVG